MQLDNFDRRLLVLLDTNANLSTSQIARILKQGRDRVEYRMDRLVSSRLITNFAAVINPHQLGGSIYKVYLKLFLDEGKRADLMRALRSHPRVFWIAQADGRWNVMFSIVAPDPIAFSQTQEELLAPYKQALHEVEVYPIISATFFPRKHLQTKELVRDIPIWHIGGAIGKNVIDHIDGQVIAELSKSCRSKDTELARQIKSTTDVVQYRIKKLEDSKIVVGYRANLDLAAVGATLYKTQLTVGPATPAEEQRFFEYCRRSRNIVYIVKQVGRCSLEIEIEAQESQTYFQVVDEIQRSFPGFIRNTDTALIRSETLKWINTVR